MDNLPELEKKIVKVYEQQIARTILDAQKLHEESYVHPSEDGASICGGYTKDWETCFMAAAKENKLSPSLWYLLHLANHWYNDIQLWAEDIIAGKDCYSRKLDHEPCCKTQSAEKCEQCQEIGLANPNNH